MELSELSDRGEDEEVKCPDAQGIQARVGILDFLLNVVKTHRRALSRTVQELLFNSCHRTDGVFFEGPSGCFGENTLNGESGGGGGEEWPGPGWWARRWGKSHGVYILKVEATALPAGCAVEVSGKQRRAGQFWGFWSSD